MSGLSAGDREDLVEFAPTAPFFAGDYDDLFTVVEAIVARHVTAALTEAADAIEAAQNKCPAHGIPDCSPLLNGCAPAPQQLVSRERMARIVRGLIPPP